MNQQYVIVEFRNQQSITYLFKSKRKITFKMILRYVCQHNNFDDETDSIILVQPPQEIVIK